MKRIAVTLLVALLALTIAPGVAEAKRRNGPPPGTTTKQLQKWIEDYYLRNTLCTYDGCTRSFTWGKLQWVGTQRVTGAKYLVYVARVDLLLTKENPPYEFPPGTMNPGRNEQTMYGWWDAGAKSVPGAERGNGGLDYGKHLMIWRTDYGQWQFGWGHYFSILR